MLSRFKPRTRTLAVMVPAVRERSPERAAAYREAGHAVAALDHGQWVRSVSVARPAETLGAACLASLIQLDLSPPLSFSVKELLERRIVTVLAGPATERWFRGSSARPDAGCHDERLLAVVNRLHRSEQVSHAYLDYLHAHVADWLAREATQRAVNTIATALVARKTLIGKQVRELWRRETLLRECRAPEPIPFPRSKSASSA